MLEEIHPTDFQAKQVVEELHGPFKTRRVCRGGALLGVFGHELRERMGELGAEDAFRKALANAGVSVKAVDVKLHPEGYLTAMPSESKEAGKAETARLLDAIGHAFEGKMAFDERGRPTNRRVKNVNHLPRLAAD